MKLVYTFNGEDFDFEQADDNEAVEFIRRTLSNDEILYDYLQYIYPHETENSKEVLKDYNFDGTAECIDNMSEEDKEDLVNEVIDDLIDSDIYNDVLMDYFEDEAYDEYRDWKEYQKDPYAYYGVSRSDFF